MPIWTYSDTSPDEATVREAVKSVNRRCAYCAEPLATIERDFKTGDVAGYRTDYEVKCCPVCGWWTKSRVEHGKDAAGAYYFSNTFGAIGVLRNLDLAHDSMPLDEVRAYLSATFESRFEIGPARWEALVASVYRGSGYRNVRVTGQANDGGIDIVMEGPSDTLVGVQVKRVRDKVCAEEIRSFAGALLLRGMPSGIFVTTSDYTQNARSTATAASHRGYRIELVNAAAFFDALRFAQRETYRYVNEPTAPYTSAPMRNVGYKRAFV